jgi:hypothetical protein
MAKTKKGRTQPADPNVMASDADQSPAPQQNPRGATVGRSRIRAAIFRIVSIIHASSEYPRMHLCRTGGIRASGDGGDFTIVLVAEHAEPELIQNLLIVATSLRVHHQRLQQKLFTDADPIGWLIDADGTRELYMKDACDKIIHADDLRFGGGTKPYEVKVYDRELPGPYVIQTVHGKGTYYAKAWEVAIDLGVFSEAAAELSERI